MDLSGTGLADSIRSFSTWVLPVLFAVTFHEAAHGFVAWRLGDDTAYRLGRVTFNPLKHVDPFGTVILPALLLLTRAPFLFGYAKPVPVRYDRLNHPRRDMILVAAAGPATNLLLAIVAALLVHPAQALSGAAGEWSLRSLANLFQLNLVLAVFNMLPLPPLDGGRVLAGLLPRELARPFARLERFGLLILLLFLFVLPALGPSLGVNLNLFGWLIVPPANFLAELIARLTGLR